MHTGVSCPAHMSHGDTGTRLLDRGLGAVKVTYWDHVNLCRISNVSEEVLKTPKIAVVDNRTVI